MADWIHKEENYIPAYQSVFSEGNGIGKTYCRYEIINNLPVLIKKEIPGQHLKKDQKWWEARPNLTLVEFLDLHCVGGWELFKISKEFRGSGHSWCIFRKKN